MHTVSLAWRRVVLVLAAATLVILVLGVGSQYVRYYLGHDHLRGVLPRLDLNTERSLPAGFSALLLGFTAAIAAVVALLERARRSRWWKHWAVLAVLVAFMSIEEVADFHTIEIIPREPAVQMTGFLHMTWVLLAIPLVALFVAIYARFWWSMPPGSRRRFFLAGAVYVGGALLMEMVGGRFYVENGDGFGLAMMLAIEEGLEFAGVLLLLAALFHHLETEFGTVALSLARQPAAVRAPADRQVPLPGMGVPVPRWAASAPADREVAIQREREAPARGE